MSAALTRVRRRDRLRRSRDAVLLVLLMAFVAALSAAAPLIDPVARADTKASAPTVASDAAAPTDPAHSATFAPGTAAAAGPTGPAAVARPAVRTMSMDEPIQGGLTAHQAQAASAAVLRSHRDAGTAPTASSWTPAMGRTAVARARSWLGMPYAWAGGSASGPTAGRCEPGDGADLDCHIVGFDCSGLMMYAWGPYAALPHLAQAQLAAGQFHPSRAQLQPGDMVFFAGYLPGGIGHVAIYEGHGMVIEAPQSGAVARRSPLSELLADDGAYRGAVRPLTGATPTLTPATTPVPHAGGTVTLHGSHLDSVTSLTVGGKVVRTLVHRGDSAVSFRMPKATGATITVTVTTSWGETSKPLTLTYATPVTTAPTSTAPKTPPTKAPPTTSPTKTPPTTTPPTKTPPRTTAPPTSTPPTSPTSAPSASPSTTTASSA